MKQAERITDADLRLMDRSDAIGKRALAEIEALAQSTKKQQDVSSRHLTLVSLAHACSVDVIVAIGRDPEKGVPTSQGVADGIQTLLAEDEPDLAALMLTARSLEPRGLMALAEQLMAEADRTP